MPIIVNNHSLDVERKGRGAPCLIFGPGSIYMPTLPMLNSVEWIGVDYYWTKKANIPVAEINQLTINTLVDDFEAIRAALKIDKILVFGPSAVGLLALEYARRYPEHTLGVILVGTPPTVQNLASLNEEFMQNNFNPSSSLGKKIATDESRKRWEQHEKNQKDFKHLTINATSSDIERYIAELKADEVKYYRRSEDAQPMYQPWENFNIPMRQRFFTVISGYDSSLIKEVTPPVLSINGMYDGIVPPFLFPSLEESQLPTDFEHHIIANAAHMPQLESPEEFSSTVSSWIDSHHLNSKQKAPPEPIPQFSPPSKL